MGRIIVLLLAALSITACASVPERVACRGVGVSAPAPAGPFPAYLAPPAKKAVLVFVHGLGGDPVTSWTNRGGVYWPRLVANDHELADFDVYVYAYETTPRGECLGVPDLATQMHTRLTGDRVFETHERVIFISHSLGGLIVREMLSTFDELVPKTPLLLFYGTPGHGVEIARLASMITCCQQVKDLRPEELNSYLRSLNNVWKHRIRDRVRSRCASEGFRRLVPSPSAEALCDGISVKIPGDHSGIVKVACERDDPHVFLKNVLREGQPARLAVDASGLSVRRITDVGDVSAVAVAPDAKTAFFSRHGPNGGIYAGDVGGAAPRKLFDGYATSIACAGSSCYFAGSAGEQGGVFRFSAVDSPQLLFDGAVNDLDVDRAGKRLLLSRSGRQLQGNEIVIRGIADGSQTVERSSPGWLGQASWHPDGASMLYVENLKDAVVHEVPAGKQTRLPRTATSTFDAAWETGGNYVLAYSLTALSGEFSILRPGGQPIGPILRDEVRYDDLRATPLPDVFSALRRETRAVAPVVSLARRDVERPVGRMNARGPFWWTGPEHLLYADRDENGSWIAEYDIHAQQVRRLSPSGWIGDPAMTPDGRHLLFSMATEPTVEAGLWTSPADRWQPVKLAQLPTKDHAISSDSKWVAFVAFGPEGGLYVTTVELGGEVRRLMRGSIWQVAFAGPRTILFKRWSDGRWLMCRIDRDGGPETCFGPESGQAFAVSPDAKSAVVVAHAGDRSQLHVIDIASGAVKKVIAVPRWISTDGGMGWTAGDERIVYVTQTGYLAAVEAYRIADGAHEIVSEGSEGLIRHLAVSPDGRHTVFLRDVGSSDAVLLTVTR